MNIIFASVLSIGVLAFAVGMGPAAMAASNDARIEETVKGSYTFKTFLKEDSINVTARDGVVTLTGTVADEHHRKVAEDTAANIAGVRDVNNQLNVAGGQVGGTQDDAWISMKVKAALMFHRSVSAMNTQVYAQNGVITLRGEADSQAQKELTTEYVQDVEGVRQVVNEMTVIPKVSQNDAAGPNEDRNASSQDIDDASITAQVKSSLGHHKSTSALGTQVRTNEGNVTLTGTANSQAEKDLVTKLVRDVNGVKSVDNNMTVQSM